MGALKQWAMSEDGIAEAERGVKLAQRRFYSVVAAAALAVPLVDKAILHDLTYEATYALGEAYERLAISRGYATAEDMVTYAPRR